MIENQTLEEPLQDQPSGLGLVRQEEDALVREIHVLARILIDAVKEKRRNGKTN